MNQVLRVELFGGVRAVVGDTPVSRFRTQKTASLLAYLAFHPDRWHNREDLIEMLWDTPAEDQSRNLLSTALSSLRSQVEAPIAVKGTIFEANRESIRMLSPTSITDVRQFREALDRASDASRQSERIHWLEQAANLYNGSLLTNCYEDWVQGEAINLADQFLFCTEDLVAELLQEGASTKAILYAKRAVEVDQLREEAQELLIRTLAATGQTGQAKAQANHFQRIVRLEELDPPSAEFTAFAGELERGSNAAVNGVPVVVRESTRSVQVHPRLGTVTILLAEVDEITVRRKQLAGTFDAAIERQHKFFQAAMERQQPLFVEQSAGYIACGFARSLDAAHIAIQFHKQLQPATLSPEIFWRMAIHTGDLASEEDIAASKVRSHTQTLLSRGAGNLILCSEETASLLRRGLDCEVSVKDLGLFRGVVNQNAERLFALAPKGQVHDAVPLPTATRVGQCNLPLPLSRFFGRDAEIAKLTALLRESGNRLVTVTGPGGSGKTRLTLETVRQLVDDFCGAVWYVPLDAVSDPAHLLSAIRAVLPGKTSPQHDPLETLSADLNERPTLLVLDNFEQLLPGGSDVLLRLQQRVPFLTVCVTSRQRLQVDGESCLPIDPLPIPVTDGGIDQLQSCPSVQLFLDRGRNARPDFRITLDNAAGVAGICIKLEGIPLAIELAAAHIHTLRPARILEGLADRFKVLRGSGRGRPARQHTLWTTIEWSYNLQAPELQALFRRLCIFRGGFTADAAEIVCNDRLALDGLCQLVDASLLTSDADAEPVRFASLETVREFGASLLTGSEHAEISQRHAEWYLDFAEKAESELHGPRQSAWFATLDREQENLRAALGHKQGTEAGLRIASALWWYWHVRGHATEGLGWLTAGLEQCLKPPFSLESKALMRAGVLAHAIGNYAEANDLILHSLDLRQRQDDQDGVASCLVNLAMVERSRNDLGACRAHLEEALALSRGLPDRSRLAAILTSLGGVLSEHEEFETARTYLEEGQRLAEEIGARWTVALALHNQGEVAMRAGDPVAALRLYQESLPRWIAFNDERFVDLSLRGLAFALHALGDDALATQLLAAAHAARERARASLPAPDRQDLDRCVHHLRSRLSQDAYTRAWEEGCGSTIDQLTARIKLHPTADAGNPIGLVSQEAMDIEIPASLSDKTVAAKHP